MISLTVITPTVGRGTLPRTVVSVIDAGFVKGTDQFIISVDGHEHLLDVKDMLPIDSRWIDFTAVHHSGDWGNTPRNHAISRATGDYIVYVDDDDVLLPGAFETIRDALEDNPGRPHMFRFQAVGGALVWRRKVIEEGMVGGHCFVPPNDQRLSPWGIGYCGDFEHIRDTLKNHDSPPIWREEVIAKCRP